jgi:hypothetical protein
MLKSGDSKEIFTWWPSCDSGRTFWVIRLIFPRSMCDYRRGLGWWLDLSTAYTITSNYTATADLHNLQITAVPAKPFPACCLHQPFPDNGVGPRTSLDAVEKWKFLTLPGLELRLSRLIASRCTNWAIPATLEMRKLLSLRSSEL